MAKVMYYDLANNPINIVGIPGVNRICMGSLSLEKLSGEDRATVVATESGKDVLQFHGTSESYQIVAEIPRGYTEAMKLHSIFADWDRDSGWMRTFSASVRVDGNATITSDECVLERAIWNNGSLTTPGATYSLRIKMVNARTIIQDIR